MLRNKLVKVTMMSQDSKQYSCIIRFLDDSEPLTVTYQVSRTMRFLSGRSRFAHQIIKLVVTPWFEFQLSEAELMFRMS